MIKNKLFLCVLLSCLIVRCDFWIWFTPSTVIQITGALSFPLDLPEKRKMFVDFGYVVSYNLPSSPEQIYNAASIGGFTRSLDGGDFNVTVETQNSTELTQLQQQQADEMRFIRELNSDAVQDKYMRGNIRNDVGAGAFYQNWNDIMMGFGFHETCLLKSVCELARHPFHFDDDEDLLKEVFFFVFTPSMHQAFDVHEHEERDAFMAAEEVGKRGGNCDVAFSACEQSYLEIVTGLHYDDDCDGNEIATS